MFFGIRSIPASGHRTLALAHMCALLQLTHISSFVSVTKLARLSWEMCRLWLTTHVWILYFESHAGLSNTGSVKASLTLLSRTTGSCSEAPELWPHVSELPFPPYTCESEVAYEYYLASHHSLVFPRLYVAGMFPHFLSRGNHKGNTKWNMFHRHILARLPLRGKKKAETCVYPDQISHWNYTEKAFPITAWY